MAELKGLLDSAKRKLGGLLGDFPAGFNSGAVAGIAGYPGDIAYMLDTAGRAITGQDTQPAAQDFPGTTDYIAAKAGYPIPGSFSGQLGAAVGGMLTPGPGDLAKFAPVLSAIPFWHGSPHKYDAVDLSKIGTGEGAQAYGWGYYGADAQDTARTYAADRAYVGKAMRGETVDNDWGPAWIAQEAADVHGDNAAGHLHKVLNARRGMKGAAQDAENQKVLEAIAMLERGDVSSRSNLYKGEYRWPDPAKEAATPLTGEDLLDWDRPLSEQPAILAKLKDNYAIADDPSLTGGDFYKRLGSEVGGDPDEISAALLSDGIPGIRYLDQMSRGAGDGTRNYVMFDDKGIKLLERNGEPIKAAEDFAARRAGKAKPYKELAMDEASRMQRAQEMGFDTPAVHWSRHGVDVNELDSGKFAIAPFDAIGTHTGTPEAAMKRFEGWASPERGAGVTYPVLIKNKKPYLDPEGKPWNEQKLTEHLREIGGYDTERADYKTLNAKLREKIFSEYDSIPYINDVEDAGSVSYITPPQNIRSRWAAFDPKNKDSANLLAGTAAAAVGLGAYKQQEEQRRRRVD